jgi:hypothetical protein
MFPIYDSFSDVPKDANGVLLFRLFKEIISLASTLKKRGQASYSFWNSLAEWHGFGIKSLAILSQFLWRSKRLASLSILTLSEFEGRALLLVKRFPQSLLIVWNTSLAVALRFLSSSRTLTPRIWCVSTQLWLLSEWQVETSCSPSLSSCRLSYGCRSKGQPLHSWLYHSTHWRGDRLGQGRSPIFETYLSDLHSF